MYAIQNDGVLKSIETWRVIIPLHDNNGNPFNKLTINEILQDITLKFPGFTVINCTGYWKGAEQLYVDENLELIVDTLPSSHEESTAFFYSLKSDLQARLGQEKIYICKELSKQEFLSFQEFFSEIGLEINAQDEASRKRLAVQIVDNFDFILQRLGYETTALHRDLESKKIIWERRLCGIILKSEFEDPYPPDIKIIAADHIDDIGDALAVDTFALIGHYEFQAYVLEKLNYRPLVKVQLADDAIDGRTQYLLPTGEPVTVQRFIEEFTMTVFTNYVVLREEGYLERDITISVGIDGSLQYGFDGRWNQLFHTPASIPDKPIQLEIIRCIQEAYNLYERSELDRVALLQAKAKNFYIFKRAILRKYLRSGNSNS